MPPPSLASTARSTSSGLAATCLAREPPRSIKLADEEVDIDLADPEVGKAASKIQSCFKARMARKSPKESPKEAPAPPPPEKEEVEEKEAEEEVVDIDLDDPEVNEAAKKMQACFKARKKTV